MTLRLPGFLVAALVLLAASPGLAVNNPIPGVDIIVERNPPRPGESLVIPLDRGGPEASRASLGPGVWQVRTSCRAGAGCASVAFTEVVVDGRRFRLPGPVARLELRLGDTPGPHAVDFPTCATPCNGWGGTGGGRFVIAAEERSAPRLRVSADVPTLRSGTAPGPDADPETGRGDDGSGGGGGAGGGGAGQP